MLAVGPPSCISLRAGRLAVSPLNPKATLRVLSNSSNGANFSITTKTHLVNLNRVLNKPDLPNQHLSPYVEAQGTGQTSNNRTDAVVDDRHTESGPLTNALRNWFKRPMAGEDTISPRSLKQLQRLLSDSARTSPKSSISSNWRELHGSKSWSGLLDPLDENLRRELVRNGEFVQATYQAFPNFSPNASQSPHLLLPDRSYRVTKSLYATSSLDLPQLVKSRAPPSVTERSSWIGYVAVCEKESEVRRMGRRDIVIALRGTATCLEWAENLRTSLVTVENGTNCPDESKVSKGFLSLYKTRGEHVQSLSESVVEEVQRLLKIYEGEQLSITVTGHSLGAALAVLVADELSTCAPSVPPIAVVSFGGPRIGNGAFADRVSGKGVKVLRVVNENDVVTRVPGIVGLMEGYEHVGTELRVDNRVSPYLRPDADPACCHDLEAYLHLVDGFMGTGCPFRSDAKRSLVRLMELQRPNVKEVYVNRALTIRQLQPAGVALPFQSGEHGCLASPSGRLIH